MLILCLIILAFLIYQNNKDKIKDWKSKKQQRQEEIELLDHFIETKTNQIEALKKQSADYSNSIELYEQKIRELNSEILKQSSIVDSINSDIKELRKQNNLNVLYKLKLSDQDKIDINYLISILPNLKNPSILNKLIWSEYLLKPFNDMIKRAYGDKIYKNVIYCITNSETKERYIGKTKGEVQKRWIEHIKSSLDIGTIKTADIHKALFNNWDKFDFTILEVVPLNENLSEREKYYINFYKTNIYGYNIKAGG